MARILNVKVALQLQREGTTAEIIDATNAQLDRALDHTGLSVITITVEGTYDDGSRVITIDG